MILSSENSSEDLLPDCLPIAARPKPPVSLIRRKKGLRKTAKLEKLQAQRCLANLTWSPDENHFPFDELINTHRRDLLNIY